MRKDLGQKLAKRFPCLFNIRGDPCHGTNAPLGEAGVAGGEGTGREGGSRLTSRCDLGGTPLPGRSGRTAEGEGR
jgi:hypothetical protein